MLTFPDPADCCLWYGCARGQLGSWPTSRMPPNCKRRQCSEISVDFGAAGDLLVDVLPHFNLHFPPTALLDRQSC